MNKAHATKPQFDTGALIYAAFLFLLCVNRAPAATLEPGYYAWGWGYPATQRLATGACQKFDSPEGICQLTADHFRKPIERFESDTGVENVQQDLSWPTMYGECNNHHGVHYGIVKLCESGRLEKYRDYVAGNPCRITPCEQGRHVIAPVPALMDGCYEGCEVESLVPVESDGWRSALQGTYTGIRCTDTASNAVKLEKMLGCNGAEGASRHTAHPIDFALGNKFFRETDYRGTGSFPIRFTRTYNSLDLGWHFSYTQRIDSLSVDRVAVRRPGGKSYEFRLINGHWTPDADVTHRLVWESEANHGEGGWRYTLANHTQEFFDTTGRLIRIENPVGRVQTVTYSSETGLHYNYFRDYDPSTGRYIESDPIGLNGRFNTYAYVDNNPIAWSDPEGLCPLGGAICVGVPVGLGLGWGILSTWWQQQNNSNSSDGSGGNYPSGGTGDFCQLFQNAPECQQNQDHEQCPGSNKQFGKKFGEHRDPDLAGYRTPQEYRDLANSMYNDPNATRFTYSMVSAQ